jgi:acyl-CoA dehydrogenase
MHATLDTAASVSPPPPALDISTSALLEYLRREAPHILQSARHHDSSADPKASVSLRIAGQFGHGQSNPTYLVDVFCASGTENETATGTSQQPVRRLVLRKKPPGKLLASAHAVEREYQVLAALAAVGGGGRDGSAGQRVPVPRPLAFCSDASVLGTPWYLMEFAQVT